MLTRFWFKFAPHGVSVINTGCGITAYDLADAMDMLKAHVFPQFGERQIVEVIRDIDIRTLEENHIRANMGVPVWRGVWWPRISTANPRAGRRVTREE